MLTDESNDAVTVPDAGRGHGARSSPTDTSGTLGCLDGAIGYADLQQRFGS